MPDLQPTMGVQIVNDGVTLAHVKLLLDDLVKDCPAGDTLQANAKQWEAGIKLTGIALMVGVTQEKINKFKTWRDVANDILSRIR